MITNEHVVAMMKAAINETEAVPPPFVSLKGLKSVLWQGANVPGLDIQGFYPTSDNKCLILFNCGPCRARFMLFFCVIVE